MSHLLHVSINENIMGNIQSISIALTEKTTQHFCYGYATFNQEGVFMFALSTWTPEGQISSVRASVRTPACVFVMFWSYTLNANYNYFI